MIGQNLFAQHLPIHLRVDLGSRDLLMSQHHLDGSQIGPALQQVGRKRVAESMGRYLLLHIGLLAITLHDVEDHDARQLLSETIPCHLSQEILVGLLGRSRSCRHHGACPSPCGMDAIRSCSFARPWCNSLYGRCLRRPLRVRLETPFRS